MVMQRGYPALAEYPLYMQQMVAERARYQTYPEKRLIVRQGQPAVAFYYILSGSGELWAPSRSALRRQREAMATETSDDVMPGGRWVRASRLKAWL